MTRSYYTAKIGDFLNENIDSIKGKLSSHAIQHVQIWTAQLTAWNNSIIELKESLNGLLKTIPDSKDWTIIFEYEIPRLLCRIDIVVIAGGILFVVEFKNDKKTFELADQRQVEDYVSDLADFHLESRNRKIIPILFTPEAPLFENNQVLIDVDRPSALKCTRINFKDVIESCYLNLQGRNLEAIDPQKWINSPYNPTPTIIQAAQALFAGKKVEQITRFGAENLNETTDYIITVIADAQANKRKVICFVTGVPGAGKTLVGLNVIHKEEFIEKAGSSAAYFSGNGPLVNVLREALLRDALQRNSIEINKANPTASKKEISQKIDSKIQNLHKFIKDGFLTTKAPFEKIVVFDEAQRCWDADNFYNKTIQSRSQDKQPLIRKSEAEIIFEIMDRHPDWAVIIALVGNGQEINTGEAGISEWGKVVKEKFPHWHIHISPELISDKEEKHSRLFDKQPTNLSINTNSSLHLRVSQRSFRASNLNEWVDSVIENNFVRAKETFAQINDNYPILITRKLETAKMWLREKITGNKRIGLLASSGGHRLRPLGINTREEINVPYWFLNDENDVRSSYYLELVATEYKIQGLEIDWACVCWDADLRHDGNKWLYKKFSGTSWSNINQLVDQQFLKNKYRVLLTRAREGIIIWVPKGDVNDPTRAPQFYDITFDYLRKCGAIEI